MTKLFVSYAHLDKETVVNMVEELRKAGHDVWIDTQGIQGGDFWVEEITKAIIDCEVFLIFISSNSVKSDHVRRELDLAFEETKKILPVRLQKVDLPIRWRYQLAGIQYIDYLTPHWDSRMLIALAPGPILDAGRIETGKLKNPYTSRPVLEPIERRLILSNRDKELNKAIQYLEDHRLLFLTGMPGIGKSTFACALLDFRPLETPDAFWYDFERQKSSGNTLGVLLERISSYLDLTFNMESRKQVLAFRETNQNASVTDVDTLIGFLNYSEPIWLVFDNLETVLSKDTQEFVDDGVALLFDSLKNTNHNAKIIITNPYVPVLKTGELLLEIGTQSLEMPGIDAASAVALLRAYGLQDVSGERVELLLRKINGHPFVLNRIAHLMQSLGSALDLEVILEEVSERLAESLKKRLSLQEFAALQSLSILNRALRMNEMCDIAHTRPSVIMHLREKGLLQLNETGQLWLHNIVRHSVRPADPNLVRQAHLRAADFYRKQPIAALHSSMDDFTNVLEWHHHAIEAGDVIGSHKALYSTGLVEQLLDWNEYELLVRLCERTLAAMYQVQADTAQVQANLSNLERVKLHHTLGNTHFLLGDYPDSIAQLEVAKRFLQLEDNADLLVRLMIDLSESYYLNGENKVAMDLCNQVASSLSTTRDEALRAKYLHLRGILHRDSGNASAAISDLEEALTIYSTLNRPIHLGNARIDLGNVYFYQNRFGEAIVNYQQALKSFEAQGDMRGIVIARFNTADIMLLSEEFQRALDIIRPALEIARRRKFTEFELMTAMVLVEAQIRLSLVDDAAQELKRLSPLILKRESARFSGYELILQACLYARQNQRAGARHRFVEALKLLENPDCQYEYARGSLLLATFLNEQGEQKAARESLAKAESVFGQLNNQLGLQATRRMLEKIPSA